MRSIITMNYFDNLWYVDGHYRKYGSIEFLPIPDWVRFYAELGRSLSIGNLDGIKRIAALSLPTRSYCAPFVAAGALVQQASEHKAESTSVFQHFEKIKALPNGSPVSIKQSGTNKIKSGTKIGFEEEWKGFGPLVKIQVSRGGSKSAAEIILVTPQRCSDVDPNPFGTTKLPINPDWEAAPGGELFLSSFLADVNLAEFYSTSSLECLILGQVNLLDSEITETEIAVPREQIVPGDSPSESVSSKDSFHVGRLQDILRVRRFGQEGGIYKSEIWPSQRSTITANETNVPSRLVIFDGSQGFIKWRHFFGKSDWVVVLDRTESNYLEAVHGLNEGYSARSSELILELRTPIPKGVDILSYGANFR